MQGTAFINEWFITMFSVVVCMNALMALLEDKLQHCTCYILYSGFSPCYLQAFKLTALGTLRCPLNCTMYTTMIYGFEYWDVQRCDSKLCTTSEHAKYRLRESMTKN
jgi:hypothetical protein